MTTAFYPPIFISSLKSGLSRVNRAFSDHFNISSADFGACSLMTRIHSEDRPSFEKAIEVLDEAPLLLRFQVKEGEWQTFKFEFRQQGDEVVVMGSPEQALEFKERTAPSRAPIKVSTLQDKLEKMAQIVEAKNPNMRCSILLIDWETECVFMGVGPSLPPAYNEAINGLKIGPMVGSCGTASYWNQAIIVENIAEDPLWQNLKDVAAMAGVAACWSQPITSTNGEVLGAMALYNDAPCAPERHHMDGLEIASKMVGLAIEHEKLEEKVRHSSKMEAVGLLAGGIAHDFNNILVAILGNAELAMYDLSDNKSTSESLEKIISASLNASDLCAQLLGFAGKQGSANEVLDCNKLVREIGELTQVAISKKIELSYQLGESSIEVMGDRSQLGQVIMNLVTNAAEAIGNESGIVNINVRGRYFSDAELLSIDSRTELLANNYATISIEDSGCGMSPIIQSKIFDPFFTTKKQGRGLGLAAVAGIVANHQGLLGIKSIEDKGTVFTLLLPQVVSSAKPVALEKTFSEAGHGNILIVDDDEMVRDILYKSLSRAGHIVHTAIDGQDGIDKFREKSDLIDCVLLDLNMPKLNGEEVFRAISKIQPNVKVVLCSGYASQEIIDRFKGNKLAGVLKKPVQLRLLLSKVAEVLKSERLNVDE